MHSTQAPKLRKLNKVDEKAKNTRKFSREIETFDRNINKLEWKPQWIKLKREGIVINECEQAKERTTGIEKRTEDMFHSHKNKHCV